MSLVFRCGFILGLYPGIFVAACFAIMYMHVLVFCYSEGSCDGVTLEAVLTFCTGADAEPPLGFHVQPSLQFNHDEPCRKFPIANTCGLILRLPVPRQYQGFSEAMRD